MSQIKHHVLRDLIESVPTWNPRRAAGGQFNYIDLSAVDQARKIITGARSTRTEEAPSRARQIVSAGDVLVSTVRPSLNGVAVVPVELDGATASTGFCVLRPSVELESRYLFHWVKSPGFVVDMMQKATGASYPAVSDRVIHDSSLPLPSLPEQRRIAEVLDRADELRANRREALAQVDMLIQSIFLELLSRYSRDKAGWDDSLQLDQVAEISSGITKGRKAPQASLRAVPYLAVLNVQDKHLDLSSVKQIEASEQEIERYQVKKDDLLLTEGGDPDKLGRGSLWNDELPEVIHQNHIFRVRITAESKVDPLFLNYFVSSDRGKRYFLQSAKQTTGIASINMSQLRRFPLLLPPIEVQQEFAYRVRAVQQLRTTHESSLTELDALFASLQDRAFRGLL
ncbi:restriction endonuclease subunit S [Micromonospora rifamycinica]|uniref:restriction endonuclease subunit S n=1 Tax=Micromonospora rifamycinica TaxID=291594 RepID=UPI00343AC1FC